MLNIVPIECTSGNSEIGFSEMPVADVRIIFCELDYCDSPSDYSMVHRFWLDFMHNPILVGANTYNAEEGFDIMV